MLVDVKLPEGVDEAELGEPPHATKTTLKERLAAKPRATCRWPCLPDGPLLAVASDFIASWSEVHHSHL